MSEETKHPDPCQFMDPHVLGKILLLQATLHAIPNPEGLVDFLCRGLEAMPGTEWAAVQINSFSKFSDESKNKYGIEKNICELCHQDDLEEINASGFLAPGRHYDQYYCIRIQTVYANYGCLLFKKSQNEFLEPYQPFLENLANTVALTLELRNHERNLQQVNEELLEIKARLEITVQERTKELTLQNTELERWGHIFEHAEWGVIVCSADGLTIELMNPAFASLHASTIAELKGQSLLGLFAPEVRAEVPGNFRLANEKGHHIWESVHIRKDGSRFPVFMDLSIVKDEQGNTLYTVMNCQDITERKRAEAHIQMQLDRLNALHHIDNAINSDLDLSSTLKIILDEVTRQLNVDAAAILLFNRDTLTIEYTASCGFRSQILQHPKLEGAEEYAGRVMLDRKTIHITDIPNTQPKLAQVPFWAGEDFVTYIGLPLIVKEQAVGVLEVFQRAPLAPDSDWFDFLDSLTAQTAIAIDNAQLFDNLQHSNLELTQAYEATIEGWSRALDLRDKETEGHTQRVTSLTVQLAQQMGIPEHELHYIRYGALLHDIGKMGIPDTILLKPGKLTPQEWDSMRKHPVYAYEMLRTIQYLGPALDIPRYHHEKWDGTGYPSHLCGEDIPLSARIFAVVDVWDAVTSDRPYRSAWSKEKAMEYIRSESGRYFDPTVVDGFLTLQSHIDASIQ